MAEEAVKKKIFRDSRLNFDDEEKSTLGKTDKRNFFTLVQDYNQGYGTHSHNIGIASETGHKKKKAMWKDYNYDGGSLMDESKKKEHLKGLVMKSKAQEEMEERSKEVGGGNKTGLGCGSGLSSSKKSSAKYIPRGK
ncbi:MAG: hypothetical protein ABH851_03230 [Methanobacteriota archaeon]